MCSKRIICYLLSTFLFVSNCFLISGSKEIVSPLRIAQCRTKCLQKFSDGQKAKQNSCLQGADCFMCWENCELLQANFHIWGSICKAELCYPGCQEACKFHRESSQEKQSEPVIKARGEELLQLENGVATWPRPSSVPPESPLVYVVMRKKSDASWTQIIQTADLSVALPVDTAPNSIRVLVVNPEGLVTMYGPSVSQQNKLNDSVISRIMADVNTRKAERISINTPKSSAWELKEVSLIHQKVLVLAEVSWEPRLRHTVYLVTWEVDGGGLKGNLFTDSTSVTLSLWPDTIYHIQVEVVSKTDKSVPLVLDTHKATQVSFDIPQTSQNPLILTEQKTPKPNVLPDYRLLSKAAETSLGQNIDKIIHNPSVARKIFSNEKSKKDVSIEQRPESSKNDPKFLSKTSRSPLPAAVDSADAEAKPMNTRQQTELAFGTAAAIILFVILCVMLGLRAKRKSANDIETSEDENRKKILEMASDPAPVVIVSTELMKHQKSPPSHPLATRDAHPRPHANDGTLASCPPNAAIFNGFIADSHDNKLNRFDGCSTDELPHFGQIQV